MLHKGTTVAEKASEATPAVPKRCPHPVQEGSCCKRCATALSEPRLGVREPGPTATLPAAVGSVVAGLRGAPTALNRVEWPSSPA